MVVPVFNRPDEVAELLESLTRQTYRDFEVIVVEDGSTARCDQVVDAFRDRMQVTYVFKPNSGPGPSRNVGFTQAKGEYMVLFDSDCLLPPHYFQSVHDFLSTHTVDVWGGPDRGHENFTPLQQAMGYTMASVLTTGGIRGGKKHVGVFQPRSFNMGLSRQVVKATGGFAFDRLAEDIELSIRIRKAGFITALIPEAFVYHKRRTTLKQFYRQVYHFGKGRVLVGRAHPGEVKLAHWFPTVFVAGGIFVVVLWWAFPVVCLLGAGFFGTYLAAIGMDAYQKTGRAYVAWLALPSAVIQLTGYGLGFFNTWLETYMGYKRKKRVLVGHQH